MKGSKSAHARSNPRTARDAQQQQQSTNREGSRSAFTSISTKPYREKKSEVTKNLEYLEEDNARLQDFMKRLNVLIEKIKHNGALIKLNIVTECDNLVKIIEKKKRAMVSQVDRQQYRKVRELEGQMTQCRRLFSTGHSVIVRTNRDLENLSMPTFMKKSDSLLMDINCAIKDQPHLRPVEDDKYDVELDLTEQKEALDKMALKGGDSGEEKNKTTGKSESRDTHRGRSSRSPRDSKGTTKRKPFIEKLMEDDKTQDKTDEQTLENTESGKDGEEKDVNGKGSGEEQAKEQEESDTINGTEEEKYEKGTLGSDCEKEETGKKEEEEQVDDERTKSAQDSKDGGNYDDEEFENSDEDVPEDIQGSSNTRSQSVLSSSKKDDEEEVQSSVHEDVGGASPIKKSKRPSRTSSSSLSSTGKERRISGSRSTVSGSKQSIRKATDEGDMTTETEGTNQIVEETNRNDEDI
ncbi:uncharacterized protein [Ptychodera flava]|uniref:uncharacterized protein n=1 Tax=Ptychodera flava TaxID=63121 RepID=UPI003969C40C